MENPYLNYYVKQAGSGISGFSGSRYQRGNGFFGKILKHLKPALRYIGRQGLKTATSIGRDLLNGENFVNSAKSNLRNTGNTILNDALDKADELVKQTGNGIKRRKVYKRRTVTKKQKTSSSKKTKKIKTSKKPIKRVNKTKKKKVIDYF